MSTLYLVATPIGNLGDITLRALETLKSVDLIAAEDTRVTGKLLAHYGITTPLFSYHEHNKKEAGEKLCKRLLGGESVALVTDAGTPAVSDPGEDLVRLCLANQIEVLPIPGACAAISALICSGFDTTQFVFYGFLPEKKKLREAFLESLSSERRTAILYESPHNLLETLKALIPVTKNRKIALSREMTKLNEQHLCLNAEELLLHFTEHAPRGEFVLVVEKNENEETPFWHALSVEEHYAVYEKQGYTKKDAIRQVAADRKASRNEIYMHFVSKEDC